MRLTAQVTRNHISRISATAALALSCAAATEAAPADDATRLLEQMQQEIERLRDDNRAMRSEIDDLRAATGDNWMNEKRATEIRAIVHDVLADADTRASLLGDGLMAGWSDGFFLADAHGRFRLEIQGQLQFRWMYNYHGRHEPAADPLGLYPSDLDRHRSGFEVPRTRLTFRGHLFGPDITYLVRGDFQRQRLQMPAGTAAAFTLPPEPHGGNFHLLDAWTRLHLSDEFSVRFGQFKLPFSREQLVSSAHQLAVERSVIDNRLNIGRSIGIDLTWVSGPHRVSGVLSNGGTTTIGGAFPIVGGGDGNAMSTGAVSPNVEWAFTARYEHLLVGSWRQFEDFTSRPGDEFGLLVGAAFHMQRAEDSAALSIQAHRWVAYTIDVSAEWGGATAYAAFTHHIFDERLISPLGPLNSKHHTWGLVLQGGVYVLPKWEVFARYEYGDWSIRRRPVIPAAAVGFDHFDQDLHLLTTGVNYYIDGHDVKWTTDIGVAFTRVSHAWGWNPAPITGWRAASGGSPLQIVFRTQLQLLF